MTNYEFLKKWQSGVFFEKTINLDFTIVTHNESDKSVMSNWALVDHLLTDDQIKQIEDSFSSLNRDSSIYFENREDLQDLVKKLESSLYSRSFEDSWMFYNSALPDLESFQFVKKVETDEDLEVFIDIFDRSYVVDDPKNPYGDVKGFIPSTRSSWKKFKDTKRIEYFVVYNNGKPGAVAALNNFNSIGYISSVGSLPEFRGLGLGKTATLYGVKRSMENGNDLHCLATEEETYPNEFYKRIGFETKFTAILMSKK